MKQLLSQYYDLLQQADQSEDRKESIRIIRESTRIRQLIEEEYQVHNRSIA